MLLISRDINVQNLYHITVDGENGGYVRLTSKGWRAFDHNGSFKGIYEERDLAVRAAVAVEA